MNTGSGADVTVGGAATGSAVNDGMLVGCNAGMHAASSTSQLVNKIPRT